MKKLSIHIFPFIAFLTFFGSCKTEEDPFQPDYGYEYFPLEIGKFIDYEMDSTIFDPTGDSLVSLSKTLMREEIVDTLSDNLGNTLYRVEQSVRKSNDVPWQIHKVLTLSIQDNQAIRTEDNLRFIKLTFPLRRNNTWDGLVHFDAENILTNIAGESVFMFKNWGRYRIEKTGEPDTIGTFIFDEVTTLREADDENLIELRVSREKYAKGIGLVHREQRILDTQKCQEDCLPLENALTQCVNFCISGGQDSVQCVSQCGQEEINLTLCQNECNALPWEEKAQKGFLLTQTIIDHN